MDQDEDKIRHCNDNLCGQAHSGIEAGPDLDFAQIMNTVGQGVLVTGKGWQFEYVNPAFARMVGKPLEDLIGRSMDDFIIPEDIPILALQRSERLAGKTTAYDFRLRRSDGDIVYVHATGVPRLIEDKIVGSISVITDLTEHKQLEEKYLQLAAIVESSDDAIIGNSYDGIITSWNKGAEKIFGYSENEIIGQPISLLAPPEHRDEVSQILEKIQRGEHIDHYETVSQKNDGRRIYESLTVSPIRDTMGKVVGGSTIARDITDRKQKEETILMAKEDWERTFDSVPDLIAIIDTDYRIVRANNAMATRLGVTPEECIGLKCYRVVHGTTEPPSFCPHRQLMEDGLDHTAEVHEDRIGGDFIVSVSPLTGPEGKLAGSVHVARDITEHKRSEEALKESEMKYRNLVERANDTIIIIQDGIIKYANSQSAKMWGSAIENIVGRPFTDFIYPNEIPKVVDCYRRRMAKEDAPPIYETILIDKDGNKIFVELNAGLIPSEEGPADLVILRDITERKKTEMKLAKELNKFKVFYDLTLEMSAEKSLEENFTFIVDKSRELLDADTSYIALLDEKDQDVRMHTLSGIRTEAFKQMHLPLGKGLYGLVMETHQRYIIDDYFKNRDIKHVVDQIIADEGLVSGMAVPIQIKDLSLGVLYVFNRHKTQFTQEDLDTLALLGNLAAVEIIREKSSNALREQLNFLQQLIDAMPNPIFYKNTKGVYLGCNRAFETSTGLTKEKIVGKTVYELYDKDLADIYYEADNKLFQNPGVQVYEASIINANGARNNVMFNKATYFNSEGRIDGLVGVILDITERKQMEIALRESERRLADIIDFLPDATMVIDKEGRVIAWNRAIEVLTGVKAEEMLGKGNHEHALPFYGQRRPILIDLVLKPQEEIEESYSNMKREGDSLVGEAYMPMLGGGETYLWGVASVLYDSQGDIVGAIESIKDITDRKRAEEALKESERRLADIINFLPDPTMVINKDGKVISWNLAIEEMTGVKAVDILGKGDYEYAIPFYGQRRPVLIDLVLKSQKEFGITYDNVERKDGILMGEAYMPNLRGTEAYLFETAAALYDSKGNVIGAIESIRDITVHKRAEEALQESKDYLNLIINSIGDPIFVKDREHRFVLVNNALCALVGRPTEEFLGMTDYDIFPKEQADIFWKMDDLVFEDGGEHVDEEEITDAQGNVHTIITKKTLFVDRTGNKHIVGVIRDITDRKKMEKELRRSRDELDHRVKERTVDLEAKNAEMERFIYTVSHDLRTPLISISGFLGFIEQDAQKGDLDRLKNDLRIVNESVSTDGQAPTRNPGAEPDRSCGQPAGRCTIRGGCRGRSQTD